MGSDRAGPPEFLVVRPTTTVTAKAATDAADADAAGGTIKNFVLGRIGDVTADPPGSARPVPAAQLELHPLAWHVDGPVEVVLRTTPEFLPDVRRWLQEPDHLTRPTDPHAPVELTYTVTNRAALRQRLYALGRRVEVVSPPDVRAELLAELANLAGL